MVWGMIVIISFLCRVFSFGADDEVRTRDIHLGKVVLYQLSYIRIVIQLSRV